MLKKGDLTKEKVLSRAVEIINIQGFANTSINDIIEATGVKKGNLYFHFSSKEDLAKSIISEAKKEYLKYLQSRIKSDNPIGKVDDIIYAIFSFHRKKRFIGGCIFGNLAMELADVNPQITLIIKEIFNECTDIIAVYLDKAIKNRTLKTAMDPQKLARHIIAALEGGIMLSKLSKKEDELLDCIKTTYSLLNIKSEHFKF